MKSMLTCMMVMMLALAGWADEPKRETDGTWKPTDGMMDGTPMPDDFKKSMTYVLKGDKYEVSFGGEMQKGTITFDNTTKPQRMKMESKEGPDAGKTFQAIYTVEKDVLKVCYAMQGNEYPKEFKGDKGTHQMLITYQRSK